MAVPCIIEPCTGSVGTGNTTFYTSAPYIPGSLQVFVNGQLLREDLDDGWVELAPTLGKFKIKKLTEPVDVIQAYYRPA